MTTPKCKTCTHRIRSGNRSFCTLKRIIGTGKNMMWITVSEMHPSPKWCPLKNEKEVTPT